MRSLFLSLLLLLLLIVVEAGTQGGGGGGEGGGNSVEEDYRLWKEREKKGEELAREKKRQWEENKQLEAEEQRIRYYEGRAQLKRVLNQEGIDRMDELRWV